MRTEQKVYFMVNISFTFVIYFIQQKHFFPLDYFYNQHQDCFEVHTIFLLN